MRKFRVPIVVFALSSALAFSGRPAAAHAGSDVVINGNSETGTRDCHGGAAVVNGNESTLAFRNCDSVVVNGNGNTIEAGAVASLSVLGNDNRMTWVPGPEGRRPKIASLGSRNAISQAAAGGTASGSTGSAGAKGGSGKATAGGSGGEVKVGPGGVSVSGPGGDVKVGPGGVTVSGPGGQVEVGPGGVSVGGGRPAPQGSEAVVVNGDGERNRYDCHGGTAAVNGDGNVLSFSNCTEIAITGDGNEIDAGVVGSLRVMGDRNRVKWTAGPEGQRPQIANLGDGNSITEAR